MNSNKLAQVARVRCTPKVANRLLALRYSKPEKFTFADALAHVSHVALETLAKNAKTRESGEDLIATHASGASVQRVGKFEPLARREITVRACKGCANPAHDAAQRTFERKDTFRAAPSYAETVRTLAASIAEKYVRRARLNVAHLRGEFANEAASAIGLFLGSRLARFPRLASDLLARFALGILPNSTNRALHFAALKACDKRLRHLAGKTALVEPAFFATFSTNESGEETQDDASKTAQKIRARCAALRERISARCANGNARRAALAHLALVDTAERVLLASVKGEAIAFPSLGLARVSEIVGTSRAFTVRASAPKESALSFQTTHAKESTGESELTPKALHSRVARLASFLGDADIARALGLSRAFVRTS